MSENVKTDYIRNLNENEVLTILSLYLQLHQLQAKYDTICIIPYNTWIETRTKSNGIKQQTNNKFNLFLAYSYAPRTETRNNKNGILFSLVFFIVFPNPVKLSV